jgi:hypothetical protein
MESFLGSDPMLHQWLEHRFERKTAYTFPHDALVRTRRRHSAACCRVKSDHAYIPRKSPQRSLLWWKFADEPGRVSERLREDQLWRSCSTTPRPQEPPSRRDSFSRPSALFTESDVWLSVPAYRVLMRPGVRDGSCPQFGIQIRPPRSCCGSRSGSKPRWCRG